MVSASLGMIDQFVARLQQPGGHQFAVQHVHLAAERFDVEAFGHGRGGSTITEFTTETFARHSGVLGFRSWTQDVS